MLYDKLFRVKVYTRPLVKKTALNMINVRDDRLSLDLFIFDG